MFWPAFYYLFPRQRKSYDFKSFLIFLKEQVLNIPSGSKLSTLIPFSGILPENKSNRSEFYALFSGSVKKLGLLFGILFIATIAQLQAATITSTGAGGDWSNPASWDLNAVPVSGDDVIIANGTLVQISGPVSCNSLTINLGGTLTINGTNTLMVNGNWQNNGNFNATSSTVIFSGNTDSSFGGTSATMFYDLTISKTNGLDDVIDFNSSGVVTCTHTLTMTNGLLKFSSGMVNLNCNSAFTINKPSGIWVAGATLNTGGFTITNEGLIRVSAGTASFGTNSGNSVHTQIDGAFEVTGGNVFVAGRLENSAGGTLAPGISSGITISGGTVTLGKVGNGASSSGTLDVSTNGALNFTGGTVVFQNSSTASTPLDVALVLGSGSGAKNTTGGTFQLGNGSTPANSLFRIDSGIPIYNLTIMSNASVLVVGNDLTISGQLKMQGGNIDAATNNKEVILTNPDINSLTRTNGFVNGKMTRAIGNASGTTYLYPVGNSTNYTPLLLNFAGANNGGLISVSSAAGEHSSIGSSLLNSSKSVNNYWQFENSGVTFTSLGGDFTFPDALAEDGSYKVGIYNGSSWIYPSASASTLTTAGFSGLTSLSGSYSFAIAECVKPTITLSAVSPICSGTTSVSLPYSGTTGSPTEYRIDYDATANAAGLADVVTNLLPASPISLSVPAGIAPATYNGTIYVSNAVDCESDGVAFQITVNPLPIVTNSSTLAICSGSGTNISLTANIPSSFTWVVGTITGGITGASAGSGSAINQILTNPSNSVSGTVQYLITPTSTTGSCIGSTYTITVTVNPLPIVTNSATTTICSGTSPNISLTASVPGNFSWTIGTITGGITGASAGSGSAINQVLTNPSNSISGSVQYLITPISTTGTCTGSTFVLTVTVNPLPAVTNSATTTICSGNGSNITLTSSAPSNFAWTVGTITGGITGATAGSGSAINQILTNPSTINSGTVQYIVTPTSTTGSCTGNAYTITVTVEPLPTITTPGNQLFCNGSPTAPVAISGAPSGVVFDISGGSSVGLANQTGVTSIPAFTPIAGTATITITPKANGCTGTPVTYSITVNPTPTATAPANQTYCNGILTTAIALTGTPSGVVFDVTGGTAVGLANQTGVTSIPAFTPIAGTATITITPRANGCTGTPVTYSITVNPTPTAVTPSDQGYCNGDLTSIIPLVGTPSGVVFDITGGAAIGLNNKTGVTQIASFTAKTGTATITITPRANGCLGTSATFVITVSPTPNVSSSPAAQTICSDGTTNITLTSTTPGATLSWTVGAISPAGSITGAANGSGSSGIKIAQTLTNSTTSNATVTYVVTPTSGGCSGIPMNVVVTVKPSPVLAITNPAPACTPTSVDLTAAAIIAGSTAGLNYTYWTDAAATIALSSPNAITTSGTYYIKGTDPVSGGCFIVKPVTVSVEPTPSLTITNPAPVCAPSTVDITSPAITAGSTPGLVLTYWVDAAATIPLANPNAVDDDTYYIKGIASGCYDIQPVVVSVYSTLGIPVFTLGASSSTCRGTSPNTYTASATNSLGITYSLDATSLAAGNTINTTSGLVTFAPGWSGTSQITATATGCGAPTQAIHSVIVNIPPTVSLTANPAIPFCEGTPVTLTATSSGGSTFITNSGSSGNINVTIPESRASWAGSTIPITGFGTSTISATDIIEVSLNITHGDNDQLDIFLVDPSGTKAMLLSTDNGGNGNNYTNATLRTNYTPNINTLAGVNTSNIAGLFGAENNATVVASQTGGNGGNYGNAAVPQSSLLGATINGNWQIRVFDDNNSGGLGTLVNWSLSITKQAGSPFTTVFNGPGTIGPITYSGAFNSTATAVVTPPAGTNTYTATTTDSNGCSGTSNTVSLVINPNPNPTITADYCSIPGKIRLTASGGGTYLWNTGATNSYIDIDIAGAYSVTVTTPAGCTGTASIGASNELVFDGSFTNVNGASLTPPSSFTSGYNYQPAPAVRVGNGVLYDDVNPPNNGYSIVNNGQQVHSNFWGIDHTQNATGNKNFMIVNGHGNYVVWQQSVNIQPNTDYYFSAWAMSVNAVPAGNCPPGPCGTTYNYAALQFAVNGTQVGTVANLGPGPNTALQANANTYWTRFYSNPKWNSGALSGLVTLSIVDLNCCLGGNDFAIDDISFATLDPLPPSVAPTVNGSTSSTFCQFEPIYLVANVSNGKPPFTYLWTGPNGFISTERDPIILNASAAIAGNYTLTLTDGYGCLPSPTGTVSVTIAPAATVNAGVDQDVCASNPTITLAGVIGGSATSGTWSGGTGTFNPNANTLNAVYTPSAAEIAAGTVTLTLTSNDPAGVCNAVSDQMTTTIFSPTVNATSSAAVGPLCHGGSDGYATIIATGGIGPYTYLWNTTPAQTTATATNLTAGTYIVRVTDIHGCFADQTIILTEPPALVVDDTPIVTEPTCFGLNNGSAEINVLSGVSPTFLWSNGQTTNPAINLTAGNYTVTITSANGCEATSMLVVVTQPDFLTAPVVTSITQPTCTVGTGTVVFDGLPTGNWTINPGAISGSTNSTTISGLSSGTYNFTVTNSAGCVSSPTAVTIDAIPPTPSCNITGTASVFSGSSYTYTSTPVPGDNVIHSWSISGNGTITGSTTNATIDVTAGAAGTFTVTDNITRLGCTNSCTYDVTVISPCSISPITGSVPDGTSTTYSAPAGMDTYSWSISGNGSIPSGITNQQSVTVLAGNACTTYTISLSMVKNGVTIPSCTQTVNVTDNQPPTFTTVNTLSYCVENIQNAVYNNTPTVGIVPEYDDLTTPRPEYYRLTAASKLLDLDPVINNFNDNCCPNNSLIIHWEILFAPTPNPASVAHELITKPPILGQTGQPSAYGDILFPGDGVTFTDIIHQINYWLEDCNGNPASNPVIHSVNITIKPRPKIIKMN